jgi:hypothetical protein
MPSQNRLTRHRILDQHERGNILKSYTTFSESKTIHKVVVYLQDDEHKGKVYVKIEGDQLGKNVIDQSIKHVLGGEIYIDEDCSELFEDEYIHIYKYPRRKNDFVYLLERKFAEDFIIGVKIIDCNFVE